MKLVHSRHFSKNAQISKFMIICQLGAEFHADRRAGRHEEANSRSSQFLRTRLKTSLCLSCDAAYFGHVALHVSVTWHCICRSCDAAYVGHVTLHISVMWHCIFRSCDTAYVGHVTLHMSVMWHCIFRSCDTAYVGHVTLHMSVMWRCICRSCDTAYADMMNSLALYDIKLLKQIMQVFSTFILYSVRKYIVHRAVFENFHKLMWISCEVDVIVNRYVPKWNSFDEF
jgi:hypothetical protein